VDGGDINVDHRLADTGYIYIPTYCKDGTKSCKFMIVSHGAGGQAKRFGDIFGPFAPGYNIVMLFP
jgi:hypothetical protein